MHIKIRPAIADLPRRWKRVILVAFDLVALLAAVWGGYSLRYSVMFYPTHVEQVLIMLAAPVIAIPVFIRMGLYRSVIRYLPERALWTILQAMTIATLCWVVLIFLAEMTGQGIVPRSVPVLYWAVGCILIVGSRFAAKRFLQRSKRRASDHIVAIYGAGDAGSQLAVGLLNQRKTFVAGFIDDNPSLRGRDVAGVRVFSPQDIPYLVSEYGVEEIILSIPSLSSVKRKEIVSRISGQGMKIRALPNLADLVTGKYLVNEIREIDIDELLGRSSVPPDLDLVRQMIAGRTIMVTGAGGSIGSELCRLIVKCGAKALVLFEANEFALYQIERDLAAGENVKIVPILGSIVDRARLDHSIRTHGVNVVFHAAAHKHVPLVEANALEGIHNNVMGSLNVANSAYDNGVESFVLISSDKAVHPTNVMGATKRWAELIVAQKARDALAQKTGQRFCAVRFGNVLGSNGSVVPLFKEQIANGGPVTLTDAAMTRYFMSIHEAAELIVQAGALSEGGDVFVLEMGSPILIRDLAENMIRLAGLTVRDATNSAGDIDIVEVGKRPGEKMYEELFYDESNVSKTRHPKILRAANSDMSSEKVTVALDALKSSLVAQDEAQARQILFSLIGRSAP